MSPNKSSFELKVGIFVIIGLVILTVIVFKIEDFRLLKPGYMMHIVFNYVSGLDIGAPVNLSGVEIGEVETMEIFYNEDLEKTQVDVTAWIDEGIAIRENSIAKIKTLGILGEKYIELTPGSIDNVLLKEGDMLFGQDPVSIEDAAESINKVAKGLDETIYSINTVIGEPDIRLSLRKSIKDFGEATHRANSILTKIDEERGTVGKLISDDKIYRDLEDLVADIKRHPWKLFHKTKEKEEEPEEDEEREQDEEESKEKDKSRRKGSVFF